MITVIQGMCGGHDHGEDGEDESSGPPAWCAAALCEAPRRILKLVARSMADCWFSVLPEGTSPPLDQGQCGASKHPSSFSPETPY